MGRHGSNFKKFFDLNFPFFFVLDLIGDPDDWPTIVPTCPI
jgi:hypothetical protein